MTVAVLTKAEADVIEARLAAVEREIARLAAAGPATDRAYLSPDQVAKRHGVRKAIVCAAIADGKLPAESRPISRGRTAKRVTPADADAWYAAFIRKASP